MCQFPLLLTQGRGGITDLDSKNAKGGVLWNSFLSSSVPVKIVPILEGQSQCLGLYELLLFFPIDEVLLPTSS